MISVLVADDSFLMRRLIADILSTDPEIRVVGSVSDGAEVIEEVRRLKPDVITMDFEMPKLNGLEATKRILSEAGAHPIVLMVSAFETDQANTMLECLHAGAFDCIQKPSGPVSLDMDIMKKQLIAKVKAAARSKPLPPLKKSEPTVPLSEEDIQPVHRPSHRSRDPFPLILIGASTGGPPVLEEIFSHLPSGLPAAVLVVQHMPEKFTNAMAERLDRLSGMKVEEAHDNETIKPGVALIAPGNFHMRVAKDKSSHMHSYAVQLSQDEPVQNLRPSIDVMMMSVCDTFPGPLCGILLTGMGEDGASGIARIHAEGGVVAVQDPATCVVDSMVQSALKKTAVEASLSPIDIARFILSFAQY